VRPVAFPTVPLRTRTRRFPLRHGHYTGINWFAFAATALVCEPEAPLSGARFVGKLGKVGEVSCTSLIRFTFEGNSILDM